MKVGIIGTRGIPNYYGGFEQFAQYLAVYLVEKKCDVYVYNSSNHPYQKKKYKGVNIVHCKDPEKKLGTIGQFVYDLNCILDSRKRNLDIILQLGYTSSSIWSFLFPKKALVITNMDGLEWKRSKYFFLVKLFLKFAEAIAARKSDFLISDSIGIKKYIDKKYKKTSKYIAYGSTVSKEFKPDVLKKYNLNEYKYNMLIARLEPENNIETILDGVKFSNDKTIFLVVGDFTKNGFGKKMKKKYESIDNIHFLGSIYQQEELNNLRYYSNLYFHGHSVGGTNPSLLEAMGSGALIIAHNNIFNKTILKENAYYFYTSKDVSFYIEKLNKLKQQKHKIDNNFKKIKEDFNTETINLSYLNFFKECL